MDRIERVVFDECIGQEI